MDHDGVRVFQCCAEDGMIDATDCGVAVIQSIPFSGRIFEKLFVFREFVVVFPFVKGTKDNN